MRPTVTVEIPEGPYCRNPIDGNCPLSRYVKRYNTYACTKFGKLMSLKNERKPLKCAECLKLCDEAPASDEPGCDTCGYCEHIHDGIYACINYAVPAGTIVMMSGRIKTHHYRECEGRYYVER